MSDPGSTTPGEIGGIFAGVTALLALIGGGIRWLLNWKARREDTRAKKLQLWHEELKEREAKLDQDQAAWQAQLEDRLARMDGQNRALRLAFELVAAPLRLVDPTNDNLAKAEALLAAAFPLDPTIPPDMRTSLGAID